VPAAPLVPPDRNGPPAETGNSESSLEFSGVHVIPTPAVAIAARAKTGTLQTIATDADTMHVEVQAHELLDAAWIHRQFQLNNMIGQRVSAARVVTLVLMLNRIFLANGYINSGILLTEQGWPATGGMLELQLINGRISGELNKPTIPVDWAGGRSNGLTTDYILSRLPAASEAPLDGNALEREFRLLAEDPAIRTINAQLNPGSRPGEATLALSVDPEPRFDSYVSVSNSRSPSVGGYRVAAGGSARNIVTAGDLLSAEVGETAGMTDGTVGYSAPLSPDFSAHARFSADKAAVVDEAFRSLGIHSTDTDWEIGLSHVFLASPLTPASDGAGWSPAESVSLGMTVAGRETTSTLLGKPFSFSPGDVDGKSSYTVFRASADWLERGERQVLTISALGSFGLRGTGSDVPGVSAPNPNFKALLVQGNYARRLNTGSLELHVRLAGQVASGLLYSGERLAVGGDATVRGYRENLLLADEGAVGSVELACAVRFDTLPCSEMINDWKTFHASIFFDGAYVNNAAAPQPLPKSIRSVGTSLSWAPLNGILASITYGYALNYVTPIGRPDLQDRGVSFEVTVHPLSLFQLQ
jgi:hemolysin activation/secretion protein